MRRSRKFLTFILVLLIINTLFFIAWYAFDLQGVVKGIVEREAGKALKGKFTITDFTISDQQVFAEGIKFAADDESLGFSVKTARVRFNLLKFIFSGFKIRNILNKIEIDGADVAFTQVPREPKEKKKFEIPDLRGIFNNLRITNSNLSLNLNFPLTIGEAGTLKISQRITDIDLSVINTQVSNVSLQGYTAGQGRISLNGVLDEGRLVSAHAEIEDLSPDSIAHPQFTGLTTRINLILDASQQDKDSKLNFFAEGSLLDTKATLMDKYPVDIPRLELETDGDMLKAGIASSVIGTSSLEGNVSLTGLMSGLSFQPSSLDLQLDLGMIDPALSGVVDASLAASGTIDDPELVLVAGSPRISYAGQEVSNLFLDATFADKELSLEIEEAIWQNQLISVNGIFNTDSRKLAATLDTWPLSTAPSELQVTANADLELALYDTLPEVRATFGNLDVKKGDIDIQSVTGYVNLYPSRQGEKQQYYVDLNLLSPLGTEISVIGEILDRNLFLDANFGSVTLADLYPLDIFKSLQPVVSGNISAFLIKDQATVKTDLNLDLNNGLDLHGGLKLLGSYDLTGQAGQLYLETSGAELNGQPISLELTSELQKQELTLHSLRLNDQLFLSAVIDLAGQAADVFQLHVQNLSTADVNKYLPNLSLPDISGISLQADYNRARDDILTASCWLSDIDIPGLRPMSAVMDFTGHPQQVEINGGIDNETSRLVDLNGTVNFLEGLDLRLNALSREITVADMMYSPLADGSMEVNLGLYLTDILTRQPDLTFDLQMNSRHLDIPEVAVLDDLVLRIAQTKDVLIVDTLSVNANRMVKVNGSGALDYNILTGNFYEGSHILDLNAEGELFDWLAQKVSFINSASGKSVLACRLKTLEDQFVVESGSIDISNARIVVEAQPEPVRNLNVKATIQDNRVILDNFTCFVGEGKVTVRNEFEDDTGSHLTVGFLDLGILKVKADQPGIKVFVPEYTAPRSISTVVVQGQDGPYATVLGPFEDMKISAELLVYDADAIYPSKTDNLLSLIYSVRGAFVKSDYGLDDRIPMPFTLDLMLRGVDNVKYTTYPTNFTMQPGGYLHLFFDGLNWHAREGSFVSELGSIDFFGTVFQTELLTIDIQEAQNIFTIDGTFNRRTADGTVVTLTVSTEGDATQSIFSRIKFNLSSDNPDDVTISNVLSRLRYNTSQEQLSGSQSSSLLQDEALNLISENLNTSLVSPFLYPLENSLRRWLRLDDFSINAGFIQNLFTEYSSDPNQLAEYTNMNQFMSDVAQFSSSILLNNLSISMSKYLGRKFFLDYTLTLQEATDLQNQTQIVVSHDTSLRWLLPEQFRLAYTFKYEPRDAGMTHLLMLQRSFRFWGL